VLAYSEGVIHSIRTIDAHAGGQPLRLIVEGVPHPRGRTLLQKREWLRTYADAVRQAVVREPRGHADMVAAVLTEPASPEAHAGLLFMDAEGYPAMSGHGVIAVTTLAIERELFFSRQEDMAELRIIFDTAPGTVHARARCKARGNAGHVDSVVFTNVPSFVHTAAHPVHLRASHIKPWRQSTDQERLSGSNGLMLAPHVDHLSTADTSALLMTGSCR